MVDQEKFQKQLESISQWIIKNIKLSDGSTVERVSPTLYANDKKVELEIKNDSSRDFLIISTSVLMNHVGSWDNCYVENVYIDSRHPNFLKWREIFERPVGQQVLEEI